MIIFRAFIKPFEAPQGSAKIKIYVIFLSLSGIETGRVNTGDELINPLKANFTKWSNTLKQFVDCCR